MYNHRLGLVLLLGVYFFSPVIIDWWLDANSAWYRPFAIWLVLIVMYFWLNHTRGTDEF